MGRSRVEYKGSSDPVRRFALFYEKLAEENAEEVRQAAEDGAEVMRQMIETRGTGRQWSDDYAGLPNAQQGRWASSPGRVASGQMRDDVSSQFSVSSKGNVVARFGWLDNVEDYYLYQEGGFDHVKAGFTVEGMYAMQDAKDLVIGGLKGRRRK